MFMCMYELRTITAFHIFSLPDPQTETINVFRKVHIVPSNIETCSTILHLNPNFFFKISEEEGVPFKSLKPIHQGSIEGIKPNFRNLCKAKSSTPATSEGVPKYYFKTVICRQILVFGLEQNGQLRH